jgi:hypothetical protein
LYLKSSGLDSKEQLWAVVATVMQQVKGVDSADVFNYMDTFKASIERVGAAISIQHWCAAAWTCPTELRDPELRGHTFYGEVQAIVRDDLGGPVFEMVVHFCRSLNKHLVQRPIPPSMKFVETVYRGSWLPKGFEVDKFEAGVEYRVPMFLASSDDRSVAIRILRCFPKNLDTHVPVLFKITIDKVDYCTQVNHLEALTTVRNEHEWLFSAYSTFQVTDPPIVPDQPSATNPTSITLSALPDNLDANVNRPLFFWH